MIVRILRNGVIRWLVGCGAILALFLFFLVILLSFAPSAYNDGLVPFANAFGIHLAPFSLWGVIQRFWLGVVCGLVMILLGAVAMFGSPRS